MAVEGQHLLEYQWRMWYELPKHKNTEHFGIGLQELGIVQSVEEMWHLFDHMTPVSELPARVDYYIFKNGIEPKWEDKGNVNGGSWQLFLACDDVNLDKVWKELWLATLCEHFDADASPHICGLSVSPRSQKIRFSLWTSMYDDDQTVLSIGQKIRSILSAQNLIDSSTDLFYYKHDIDNTGSKPIHKA